MSMSMYISRRHCQGSVRSRLDCSDLRAKPHVTAVTPSPIPRASPPAKLNITGSDFVAGCQVKINGTTKPANAVSEVSPTQLTVAIAAGDIPAADPLKLVIVNPNGDVSNEFQVPVS